MGKFFSFYGRDLAIDFGTSNIRIGKNDSVVLDEPCVVTLDIKDYEPVAVGKKAYEMIGKTPEDIIAIKPMENGLSLIHI